MKMKFLAATLLSLSSLSAMAISASTDALVKALVSSGKLGDALEKENNVEKVEISRLKSLVNNGELDMLCGSDINSRSGAVLNVKIIYASKPGTITTAVQSKTLSFSTPESPAKLKLCEGRN